MEIKKELRMGTYEQWVESLGLPIYKGYYNEDLRTVETGWWEQRGCNTAFISLIGNKGVGEARVTEIPPRKTTLPWKFALDEVFYVLEGRGLTTIWGAEQSTQKTFEWQKYSMFLIPHQCSYQLTNGQGDKPAKLVSYNHLPYAMEVIQDPEFFFNNPYVSSRGGVLENLYSEAKEHSSKESVYWDWGEDHPVWYGYFFPDMRAWAKLRPQTGPFRGTPSRGPSTGMGFQFPNSPNAGHMMVLPARRYKKAHRHGPGVFIVIPGGEGYSIIWEEGKEKILCPWHEGSCFTPPDWWFHQHFNVDSVEARCIALSPPIYIGHGSRTNRDNPAHMAQIEYPDEDPWLRQTFEKELAKRGLTSLMDEEAYKNRNYQWKYELPVQAEGKE